MSLHAQLLKRQAEGRPIRVGLIGAGKFGSMYLAQIPRTPGVHLVGIADLSPDGARRNLARVGWNDALTRACEPRRRGQGREDDAHRRRLEGARLASGRST
jgi:predicted homoserine dehydrogenase-like protein